MHGLTSGDAARVGAGYHPDPERSMTVHAEVYTEPRWSALERTAIFGRSWQLLCHGEKLREPGNHVAGTVAGMPVAAVRGKDGGLRAFYNVCKHRAHHLLSGEAPGA